MRKSFLPTLVSLFILSTIAKGGETRKVFTLDCKKDLALGLASIGSCGLGFHLHKSVSPPNLERLHKEGIFIFDRFAAELYSGRADRASDITLAVSSSLPMILATLIFLDDKKEVFTDVVMYAESVVLSNGLVMIAKGLAQRPRPYAYNPQVPLEKRRGRDAARSFYSGHTSAAFNGAVFAGYVYNRRHPDSKWRPVIWVSGLSVAAATGVLRVAAGQHFPTDILAGAAMGSLTGFIVPYLHLDRKNVAISLQFQANEVGIYYRF